MGQRFYARSSVTLDKEQDWAHWAASWLAPDAEATRQLVVDSGAAAKQTETVFVVQQVGPQSLIEVSRNQLHVIPYQA